MEGPGVSRPTTSKGCACVLLVCACMCLSMYVCVSKSKAPGKSKEAQDQLLDGPFVQGQLLGDDCAWL